MSCSFLASVIGPRTHHHGREQHLSPITRMNILGLEETADLVVQQLGPESSAGIQIKTWYLSTIRFVMQMYSAMYSKQRGKNKEI